MPVTSGKATAGRGVFRILVGLFLLSLVLDLAYLFSPVASAFHPYYFQISTQTMGETLALFLSLACLGLALGPAAPSSAAAALLGTLAARLNRNMEVTETAVFTTCSGCGPAYRNEYHPLFSRGGAATFVLGHPGTYLALCAKGPASIAVPQEAKSRFRGLTGRRDSKAAESVARVGKPGPDGGYNKPHIGGA